MSIDSDEFLKLMRDQFDHEKDRITMDQPFRNLQDWSSLQALIVITTIDEAYDVTINEQELQNAQTFGDLFTLVDT
ncbi:MAG: hypothetical protein Salg2KO_18160 [Salibacteraceae bacterium]